MTTAIDSLNESEKFLTPAQRFAYLRIIPATLFLLDSEDPKAMAKIKGKKRKVERSEENSQN